MRTALILLQLLHVLFLALHDWVPMPPLNDVAAARAENPGGRLLRVTIISTLPYAIGLAGSLFNAANPFPLWLTWWLWISYGLLFAGELRAWWIPYLLKPEPLRAQRYRALFGATHAFLPQHYGITPNTLHAGLHLLTLAMLVLLAAS
jgi:hypothetical protein